MDFQTAVKTCFQKYATIEGRARRSEYWWFVLFAFIANIIFSLIDAILFGNAQVLAGIFGLAILLPSICVGARRLHDTGRSAWWLLLILIPLVGFLVLLWWFVQQGTDGANEYGPDPLGREARIV